MAPDETCIADQSINKTSRLIFNRVVFFEVQLVEIIAYCKHCPGFKPSTLWVLKILDTME